MATTFEPDLETLTARQRAVLDLRCQHYSYKEISQKLDISPRTAEGHLESARNNLHCATLSETVRTYQRLTDSAGGKSPEGFERVDKPTTAQAVPPVSEGNLTFHDAAVFSGPAPWQAEFSRIPEVRPSDVGPAGRLGAILLFAALLSVLVLVGLAIAATLGDIV